MVSYFLMAQLIPTKAYDYTWNSECEMNLVVINGCYAYGTGGITFLILLAAYFRIQRIQRDYTLIERTEKLELSFLQTCTQFAVFTFLSSGLFWIGMNVAWKDNSPACWTGWEAWQMYNFVFLYISTLPMGVTLGSMILCSPCCCPVICQFSPIVYRMMTGQFNYGDLERQNANQEVTNFLLQQLNKVKYYSEGKEDECVIC